MSKKITGSKAILYNATSGTLVDSGNLDEDTWYKIASTGTSTALPTVSSGSTQVGGIFKTPADPLSEIQLATGDSVYPLTLEEVCKVDMEVSGEMGVIETTDSCDYPYMTNIPDGFTNLSGSINTMMRFDETTEELVDVTQDFLVKFYDIVNDDGEGTYSLTSKNDSDLLLMILINKEATTVGEVQNWLITPAILNSISTNFALKDVDKADYGWTKGQGPASIYIRTVAEAS